MSVNGLWMRQQHWHQPETSAPEKSCPRLLVCVHRPATYDDTLTTTALNFGRILCLYNHCELNLLTGDLHRPQVLTGEAYVFHWPNSSSQCQSHSVARPKPGSSSEWPASIRRTLFTPTVIVWKFIPGKLELKTAKFGIKETELVVTVMILINRFVHVWPLKALSHSQVYIHTWKIPLLELFLGWMGFTPLFS